MYHRHATTLLNAASKRIKSNPSSIRATLSSNASHHLHPTKEQSIDSDTNTHSKPYIPLYHHVDPSLFPPLLPGSIPYILHNATAAFQALISLASSEELRLKFLSIAKIYGLSPQLNEAAKTESTKEDEDSLYQGCIINTNVVGQSDMGLINVFSLFDGLSSPLYDGSMAFDVKEFMDGAGFALEQFHKVDHDFFLSLKHKTIGDDYDFLTVAKSDPDSLEHDIMKMTTPPFWSYFNGCLREYFNIKPFLNEVVAFSTPAESRVTHLALLSARVAEIEKPTTTNNTNDDSQQSNDSYSSTLNQIVTQLEVLYEREILPTGFGEEISSIVNVATFEACILGDPNGEQLQWRLCQTRPASEFPYLV